MTEIYFPMFALIGAALLLAGALFTLTSILGPKNMTAEKALPYESGSLSVGGRFARPSVKFYLTAILFVVFDIEAVFLYPWGAIFRKLGVFGLVEMGLFLGVLGVTLIYCIRKGALEWER